ncbi:MAG: hypothetical protein M1834_007869 [Cirrosporium novae-zelandiae]|nr:MAG: hypothetical protein M1834_007869 [Cirrosporium novae-zelandiae]
MPPSPPPPRPPTPPSILYHDASFTTILLDIPKSLSEAQQQQKCLLLPPTTGVSPQFLAPPGPTTPFPTPEPKTPAARQRVLERIPREQRERDELIRELVGGALEEVGRVWKGGWCLERVGEGVEGMGKSEGEEEVGKKRENTTEENNDNDKNPATTINNTGYSIILNPTHTFLPSFTTLPPGTTIPVQNPHPHSTHLTLFPPEKTYTIPPQSHFLPHTLTPSIQTLLPTLLTPYNNNPRYTHILLDPPYPNRSASHSSSYLTPPSSSQTTPPLTLFQNFLIENPEVLAPEAVIAIWVTNSARARRQAREFLEGVGAGVGGVVEEWVWVKVTQGGLPVVGLGGVWRRGWEVCLVARVGGGVGVGEGNGGGGGGGSGSSTNREESTNVSEPPPCKRRIIIAVPTFHSQKPSLAYLLPRLFPVPSSASPNGDDQEEGKFMGLEVFARNLSAGWFSVGDECLKFNEDVYWG